MTDTPMTPDAALTRLRQYGERTSAWSTATYNDGTEKALHQIALTLAAEVDRLRTQVTEAPATLAALMASIQELRALQQPLVDGLRFIREDMDRASKGGDEWATEWMGQVWLELPLTVRAAGGDTDAAQELADEARQAATAIPQEGQR